VRDCGKGECFFIERLAGNCASDPSAAPARRMFWDLRFAQGRVCDLQPVCVRLLFQENVKK